MTGYQHTNFAEISNELDSIEQLNPKANENNARSRYIEYHIDQGFQQDLMNNLKDENNPLLHQNIVQNSLKLVREIEHLYHKNKNNFHILFQLEQILGQAKDLFDNKANATDPKIQNQLENIRKLTQELSGHESLNLKKLGLLLALIGVAVLLLSIVILSLATLGGGVGFFIGLSLVVAGVASFWTGTQKGLALEANHLIDSFSQVQKTLDYYHQFISPMLQHDDREPITEALKKQLELGFPAHLIKGALAWAKHRNEAFNTDLYNSESYNYFFNHIADICYVSHSNDQWLSHQRIRPNDDVAISKGNSDGTSNNKIKQYTSLLLWKTVPKISPAVSYFDQVVFEMIDKKYDRDVLKEGLQKLIKNGHPSQDLKLALQWAVGRHNTNKALNPESPENDTQFFERVATICGAVLAEKELVYVQQQVQVFH